MEAIYGMSKDARCSFVHRHKIPSRVVYGKVQYSKNHIDIIKNGGFDQREKYYSVAEVMEKYGLRRDDVYNYARYNNIRKMHHGKSMLLLKEDVDKVMAEKSVTWELFDADRKIMSKDYRSALNHFIGLQQIINNNKIY